MQALELNNQHQFIGGDSDGLWKRVPPNADGQYPPVQICSRRLVVPSPDLSKPTPEPGPVSETYLRLRCTVDVDDIGTKWFGYAYILAAYPLNPTTAGIAYERWLRFESARVLAFEMLDSMTNCSCCLTISARDLGDHQRCSLCRHLGGVHKVRPV